MNKCDCKNQNCNHNNVYVQPPRGKSYAKHGTYIRPDIPMQYKTEQKLSYKNYPINGFININSSSKSNCFEDNLKFGFQYPTVTIQQSSYKKWTISDELDIKKPRDCSDLIGRGSIDLNTTKHFDFQRKNITPQSKHYEQPCSVFKLNTQNEIQSTIYQTSYMDSKIEKKNVDIFKPKSAYINPTKKMETMTTNNINYKNWIRNSNNSNIKTRNDCQTKKPIEHQTSYNYCYTVPGTYIKEVTFSSNDDLCIKECCD
ncbi:uncharacterized protein LOC132943869 [Metopolophium dirhodum]|uniref:uncharacterized protein LOC132943869 n=1 Tax=Metopolophium dirhodum TaxID=44670 RepID=UPI00298FF0AA|nr:uncharacterized protein LOC132943869 [Metopolophium dirhodum]